MLFHPASHTIRVGVGRLATVVRIVRAFRAPRRSPSSSGRLRRSRRPPAPPSRPALRRDPVRPGPPAAHDVDRQPAARHASALAVSRRHGRLDRPAFLGRIGDAPRAGRPPTPSGRQTEAPARRPPAWPAPPPVLPAPPPPDSWRYSPRSPRGGAPAARRPASARAFTCASQSTATMDRPWRSSQPDAPSSPPQRSGWRSGCRGCRPPPCTSASPSLAQVTPTRPRREVSAPGQAS